MNCDWEDVPDSSDARGWRRVRCLRCGEILKGWTPHPFEKIERDCLAWPRGTEWGYWVSLFLEVFGLSKRRWAWIVWKTGFHEPGSPDCYCPEREAWLNSLPGRLVTAYRKLRGKVRSG